MRNKSIETFYWVAKIGNFRAVAERLNTTQSAISARIRSLESELGFELFDRVGRVAKLNSAGRQFLQYAEEFMSISDEVERSFTHKEGIRRTVRLGTSDTIASSWIMNFIHAANETYPGVTFEMLCDTSPNIKAQLLAYEVDIGFIVGPAGHVNLEEKPICCYPMVWVASPHLALPDRRLTLSDMAQQTIMTFPPTTAIFATIASQLRKATRRPKLHCASSTHTMLVMAQKGWCLTVLPRVIVAEALRRKELKLIETCIEFEDLHYVASFLRAPATSLYESLADIAVDAAQDIATANGRATPVRSKTLVNTDRNRALDGRESEA